jgi:hypothetical protein
MSEQPAQELSTSARTCLSQRRALPTIFPQKTPDFLAFCDLLGTFMEQVRDLRI